MPRIEIKDSKFSMRSFRKLKIKKSNKSLRTIAQILQVLQVDKLLVRLLKRIQMEILFQKRRQNGTLMLMRIESKLCLLLKIIHSCSKLFSRCSIRLMLNLRRPTTVMNAFRSATSIFRRERCLILSSWIFTCQ